MSMPQSPQRQWPSWCLTDGDGPPGLIPDNATLQLAVLRFDRQGFDPSDYHHCGVPLPEALSRAVGKRQAEFLAGRLCAGEALRRHLGSPRFPARHADGAPVWPANTSGSITHSAGIAMAVVGDSGRYPGLGLDLEVIQTQQQALPMIAMVLTGAEQARHRAALEQNPGLCLTRLFALKEALFKALYPLTRKRFYFHDAEVTALQAHGDCRLRLLSSLSGQWPEGAEVMVRLSGWGDRVAALALPCYENP